MMAALNMSRVALAQELSVDKSVVRRWLSGATRPTEHNLTRLVELLRRVEPNARISDWLAPGAAPAKDEAAAQRLTLSGLRSPTTAAVARNYEGLWCGFMHLSERDLVRPLMCVLRIEGGELCAQVTDGSNLAEGVTVAASTWLQMLFEVSMIQDRLWMVTMHGVAGPASTVMTGLLLTGFPGIDQAAAVTATPLLLLRTGTLAELATIGGIAVLAERANAWRTASAADREVSGDPLHHYSGFVAREILEALKLRVGIANNDGETDHVARMPRNRAPISTHMHVPNPDGPVAWSIRMLRRALELPA